MKYRLLGQTGLYVSELCLGTMTYGSEGFWKVMGGLGQSAVNEQIAYAFEHGVNFIDTANVYALGQSETLVGQALRELKLPRDQLVIATKATGVMDEKTPNDRGQSRYHLFNQVDASLKRLQVDHIDLYQLHGFDPLTPFEESLSALDALVRSGKVRYVGVCNMAAWQIMKAQGLSAQKGWARFASLQAYYTVAGRDLERELVPLLQDQHMGLMVWSPLAGGLLSGKFQRDGSGPAGSRRASFDFPLVDKVRGFDCVDAMRPMAEARGVSVAQIALAWLLSRQVVSAVIIGARTMDQLRDNIAASGVILSVEELAELDRVSKLPPEYPGWMIERQGQYRATPPVHE
ncbi:MAG: aldo/keto reductase [Paludibacterium sp.]|uniref:aldo/keto reductase n=1 Tax=Paludibacterium sp. TaxID=1917523 RepID=UPI0025D982DF|nr:aldo/keto reductase [Paludibacterium sp.]MBV8048431.1 aldo/keto reductase [Paludibacterium sp.]MBV8649225.1 aldo/keto reductase [Paludibacterium sp.]